MKLQSFLFSAAILGLASAFAGPISTGQANWQAGAGTSTTGAAVVETGQVPTGIWIWTTATSCALGSGFGATTSGGTGCWVGTAASDGAFASSTDGALPGTYTFTLDLGATNGGKGGTFSFAYAADNGVVWSIGSTTLATCTDDCFTSVGGAPRTLTGSFNNGDVLKATITNTTSTRTPMGLAVIGSTSDVPEPSTYAMLALGGVAALAARLRRR